MFSGMAIWFLNNQLMCSCLDKTISLSPWIIQLPVDPCIRLKTRGLHQSTLVIMPVIFLFSTLIFAVM